MAAASLERNDITGARAAIDHALRIDPQSTAAKEIAETVIRREDAHAELERSRAKAAQTTRDDVAQAVASTSKLDAAGPVSREPDSQPKAPTVGTRHAVSYAYCRLCSEYGHAARDCPLRKK